MVDTAFSNLVVQGLALVRQRPGIIAICLVISWCGIWNVVGAAYLLRTDTEFAVRVAVAFFVFAIFCFLAVFGLVRCRPWSPRLTMVLSAGMLVTNVTIGGFQQESPLVMRGLFVVVSGTFAILVVWYLSKSDIRRLYRRGGDAARH